MAFNVPNGQVYWTYPGGIIQATQGGGVAVFDSQGNFIQVDSLGNGGTPSCPACNAHFIDNLWTDYQGAPGLISGPLALLPPSPWPLLNGNPENQNVAMPVPTSLKVLSAKAIPPPTTTLSAGCPVGSYGLMIDIVYQVLDQSSPPKPIKLQNMLPEEKDLNYVFNGIPQGDPIPNWQNIMGGRSPITGSRKYTDANGTFEDAPFGICASGPFTSAFTQPISILLNRTRYDVRTNDWSVAGTGPNHGNANNAIDIDVNQ